MPCNSPHYFLKLDSVPFSSFLGHQVCHMFDYHTVIPVSCSSFYFKYFLSYLLICSFCLQWCTNHPVDLGFNYCIFQLYNFRSVRIFLCFCFGYVSKIITTISMAHECLLTNLVIYPSILLPHPPSRTTTDLLSVPILHFLVFYVWSYNMHSVWLLSFNIILLKITNTVVNSSFLFYCTMLLCCMDKPQYVYLYLLTDTWADSSSGLLHIKLL